MSQHDFNIANQTFPSFRADLNDALVAAATMSAGASAPTTPYAYQLWFDTTTSTWKVRNSGNTAWISTITTDLATGNVGIGTVSPQSTRILHTVSSNASQIRVEGTGAESGIEFKDSGSTNFPKIGSDGDDLFFDTAYTQRMTITGSGGNVGIGNSIPSSFNAFANQLVVGNGQSNAGITIYSGTANASSLSFADGTTGDESYRGYIYYNHFDDSMGLYTAGANVRLRIGSSGTITYNNEPTSGGGVNVSLSASYNDTSNHVVGGVNAQSFALITINTSNGATHIPVYRNGGAGVAYAGTMLDPDNQTWVALGTSITFNQTGSFPQTFVVSITGGGSVLNVQRTSGINAYSVYVQLLG